MDLKNVLKNFNKIILTGSKDSAIEYTKKSLSESGLIKDLSQDFLIFEKEEILLEDAINFKNWLLLKPINLDYKKVGLLCFSKMKRESQDVLLKVVEELEGHSIVILQTKNKDYISETLQSRMICLPVFEKERNSRIVDSFLKLSPKERIDLLTKYEEDIDTLENIMEDIYKEIIETNPREDNLKTLFETSKMLKKGLSSRKHLIEMLSLSIE
ncbi:hypothetical protein KC842_00725 [Candidatus Nomurabacteria bacterium]|nr:hypothetical protein [Candidatus Nomurabacteria bacterium]USN95006.1 MAG: hypothetical protein H6791_01075 [Candidatus Nomurabacteria bacterium]